MEPTEVERTFCFIDLAGFVPADTLDPVCRMSVDAAQAAGWLGHAGQRYTYELA